MIQVKRKRKSKIRKKSKVVEESISHKKSIKINKFIVYLREFDKFDKDGLPVCRNTQCSNLVRSPLRKYCSNNCSKEFLNWYTSNFYWRNIRNYVLKRDNYTCKICGIKLHKKKKYNAYTGNWLECDHILPKYYYTYLGYKFDTLDNKIKTIIEYLHNKNNLRTVCHICHKQITTDFYQQRRSLFKNTSVE